MNTVAHTASCVHEITQRAQLRQTIGPVFDILIRGIIATGSVILSEVLRPQVTKASLHAAEQRASQALKNGTELDNLPDAYLAMVASAAYTLRFRSLDGSDMSKPASRKLEALDVIRDGSAKPRDRVVVGPAGVQASVPRPPSTSPGERNAQKQTRRRNAKSKTAPPVRSAPRSRTVTRAKERKERKIRPASHPEGPPIEGSSKKSKADRVKVPSPPALKKLGYWMVQIEAGDGTGNHLSLFRDIFSTMDPAYLALGEHAWTITYQQAVERVLTHVGRGGVWLLDRGFDDIVWMNWLHEEVDQHVIRLKANRLVRLGTIECAPVSVGQIAQQLDARNTTRIRYVDKSTHQEKYRSIPFAWAPIWIDGVGHPVYLIVAHTGRKRPMLLITDRRPEGSKEAGELIQAFLERWGNEEVTRAGKQLTGLESIRVRALSSIRRLAWIGMIAVGIQELLILTRPRLKRAILDRAKEFIKEVRYVIYRVWRVVQEDMAKAIRNSTPLLV